MASPADEKRVRNRGTAGGSLDPDLVVRVGSAFAEHVKRGKVVVGRDSRPTGEIIAQCLESVLALAGCDVVDIGIVPTPTVQLAVEELHAAGGVVISASHNPIEWNAFKLIGSTGSFLNQKEINKFFALMEKAGKFMPWDRVGTLTRYEGAQGMHIDRVIRVIDAEKVRKASFKVALDSVNGAGSIITPELLKRLGCTTVPVHCTIDGTFPGGQSRFPRTWATFPHR